LAQETMLTCCIISKTITVQIHLILIDAGAEYANYSVIWPVPFCFRKVQWSTKTVYNAVLRVKNY
jgi:hypothetical protein